jgi:hypothetical protein
VDSFDGNTIVGATVGVKLEGNVGVAQDNVITDCTGSGLVCELTDARLWNNIILRCAGYGVDAMAAGDRLVEASRNIIRACGSGGIRVDGPVRSLTLSGNVVGRCGGPGVTVATDDQSNGSIVSNTSYLNKGPGYVTYLPASEVYERSIANNIALGNSGPGLLWTGSESPNLACNDWYGNSGGMISGAVPGLTDVSTAPLFCDLNSDDVRLSAGSPLLNLGACGRVGALGQGCLEPIGNPGIGAFTVSPNPSRGVVQFAWTGSAWPKSVDVYDVTGARRWGQHIEPGASTLVWPGTDMAGRRLPAGVYYARLTGRGVSANARFVLVQ